MTMTKRYLGAAVKELDRDDPTGTFEAVVSTPTVDRDGEVIAPGAFNPLPASIPIHVDHDFRVESVVARATPYYDGDRLRVRGTFAGSDRAQNVRGLVADGSVNTMSVGFLSADRTRREDGTLVITKAELMEASFVSIPSNREALVLAARSWHGEHRSPATALADEASALAALLNLELAEHALRTLSCRPGQSSVSPSRRAKAQAEAILRKLLRS